MVLQERRVIDVPHHQAKLDAATPIVGDAARIRKTVLEVDGSLVNIIAEREQQNAPKGSWQTKISLELFGREGSPRSS